MVVVLAGVLFALSVMMGAAALAQGEAPRAGLTLQERERFVDGAKEIAGLSEQEISAALKDPDAVEAIPVRVEETQDRPRVPDRGARSASDCSSMSAGRNYYNVKEEKLFVVSGRKEWCFNFYSAVTYAPRATFDYTITEKGRETGWAFKGVADRQEKYVAFRGFPRGSHVSRVVLRFRSCDPDTGRCTPMVYPQYRGVGNYDGTGYQKTKTLGGSPN